MIKNNNVKEAFELGYRIDKNGNVVGLKGNNLSLNSINKNGYSYFSYRFLGKRKNVLFHHLQAYTKFGLKMLANNIQVRHLNGIKKNNTWDNIEIGTQSQNQMDIAKEDRIKRSSHPKHNHWQIITDRNNGMKYEDIMKKHGISSKGTLSYIINKSINKEG